MKISIITVVYNNELTIEDAITSVLSQTYEDVEYVIIDGKSSDNTTSIINKYAEKISVFISEPDKGLYDAMNKGINAASGDIIGILNSDDLYQDEHVLSDVISMFKRDASCDIVYGDLVYVKQDNVNQVVRRWKSKPYYPRFFEHGYVPPHPALFLKKNVYKEAGSFDLKFKLAADYEFMFRVMKKFNFRSIYYPRLMVKMRLGGATNKNISNIINGNKEIMKAWQQNGFNFPIFLMPLRMLKRIAQFF